MSMPPPPVSPLQLEEHGNRAPAVTRGSALPTGAIFVVDVERARSRRSELLTRAGATGLQFMGQHLKSNERTDVNGAVSDLAGLYLNMIIFNMSVDFRPLSLTAV